MNGLKCRRCGCRDLRVLYTRRKRGRVVRLRVCRHCGKRMLTSEREGGVQQN